MNDEPRRTLRELIARHGPGLCSDARRCEGLLRDLCGGHRREVNTLVGALRERVPLDLLASRNSVPTGLLLSRLAKRLEDQLALTADASRWAVDSWALALGIVSDAELGEMKRRRDEAARVEAAPPTRQTPPAPRPAAEDETPVRKQPAPSSTRPPAPTPPARPTTPPRASRTGAQGGSTVAPWQPSPPPAARPPVTPQPANAGGLQTTPANDPALRPGRGRRRGCWVGCVLLLLLLVLLAAGAPFVINLLREEQLQRNAEPAPGQTR